LPKIIAAKTLDDVDSSMDGLAIAISGIIADSTVEAQKASALEIPVLNGNTQMEALADLVEQKAFTLLPNLTECAKCHPTGECGYVDCYQYAKAIVAGKVAGRCCPLDVKEELMVWVNGVRLPLKEFPAKFLGASLVGMFGSLHGGKDIKTLKVELRRTPKNSSAEM
jgi:molybdopterin-guanine dinucleotide biosynthesis protein B